MAKITLNNLTNLNKQGQAVSTINNNMDTIETAFENTLSRDGTSPNSMAADLDMDSNRILNLPEPILDTEPVRLGDLGSIVITSGDTGAPLDAAYIVSSANTSLTAERVLTDTATVTWDFGTVGQAKATSVSSAPANDSITFAKVQNIATDSLIGRDTAGTGDPENITLNSTLSMTGAGVLQRAALTGDVTASAGSNTTVIANDAVTYAKLQNVSAASRLLGRGSASGAGNAEEILIGSGLVMSGTTLSSTGTGGGVSDIFINVKDYGATGLGVADDTTAIQAAIDAAGAAGGVVAGAALGATVFFPPGTYKTTSALRGSVVGSSICLIGSGSHNTLIFGTFAGYIIQHDDVEGEPCPFATIEKLYIKNAHSAAGSGALKLSYAPNCVVKDCYIQGFNGIDMSRDSFNGLISNCTLSSPFASGTAGTVGIYAGQTTIVCTAGAGWDVGISVGSSTISGGMPVSGGVQGFACIGCRIESSNTGMLVGRNALGELSQSGGFVSGFTTERCNTSIYLEDAAGLTISGTALTGTINVAGDGFPTYGLRVGTADRTVIINSLVGVSASTANIDVSSSAGDSVTFIGCKAGPGTTDTGGGGVCWNMPSSNKAAHTFINCDNPTSAFAFASLPATLAAGLKEGAEYNITDGSTATWGATCAGSGSNHVKVRYNGTNWTVVGK